MFWGGRVTAGRRPLSRRTRRVITVVAATTVALGGWLGGRSALVPVMPDGANGLGILTSVGVPVTVVSEFDASRIRVPAHLTSVTIPDLPAGVHVAFLGVDDPTYTVLPNLLGFPGDPRWHLSRLLVPLVGQPLIATPIRFAEVITVDRPGTYALAAPLFGWSAGPWRGHVTQGFTVALTTRPGQPDYNEAGNVLGPPPTTSP